MLYMELLSIIFHFIMAKVNTHKAQREKNEVGGRENSGVG